MRKPHKWLLRIEPNAKLQFNALSRSNKQALFRKLRELLTVEDPYHLLFVEMLQAKKFERHRKFRIGDYRVLFVIKPIEVTHLKHTYKGILYILNILDRKEAY
jgi:mRNA-degrading endonuclease RelE of RelBE toxin-antitoxin system